MFQSLSRWPLKSLVILWLPWTSPKERVGPGSDDGLRELQWGTQEQIYVSWMFFQALVYV